jgi:hypothetical protein
MPETPVKLTRIYQGVDRVDCREVDLFPFGQSPIIPGNGSTREP